MKTTLRFIPPQAAGNITLRDSIFMTDWTKNTKLIIAAKTMTYGGVIAYPTEAVWGLGCNPFDQQAVLNLLSLKGRAVNKGLILVAESINQFDFVLKKTDKEDYHQLQTSWPGPHTWLVPHSGLLPGWIHGDHATVALRVSAHPVVKALCLLYGGPVVSTSANLQGLPAAKYRWQVQKYFFDNPLLNAITPGNIGNHPRPSVIQDLKTKKVLRQ